MSAFNLGDYVDVPTRLAEALKRWPNLRIQETRPVIVTVDNQAYVEISCTVWRDDTDPLPTTAYCWEPIPGRTPYTKGSEMMNASTSVVLARTRISWHGYRQKHCITQRGTGTPARALAEVKPIRDDLEQPFGDTTDTKQYASPKQRGMIRARAFEKKIGTTI
jgi:hypothetical protein